MGAFIASFSLFSKCKRAFTARGRGQRLKLRGEERRRSLVVAPWWWWDRCLFFCVHAASRHYHGFPFPSLGNLLALPAKKSVLLCSLSLTGENFITGWDGKGPSCEKFNINHLYSVTVLLCGCCRAFVSVNPPFSHGWSNILCHLSPRCDSS